MSLPTCSGGSGSATRGDARSSRPTGRRCSETSYLEFHHVEPYGIGGEATVANIALRCRAHNAFEAELVFGERAMRRSPKRGQGEEGGAGDSHGEGGAARASL